MEEKIFSKSLGELIRQVRIDKKLSYQDIARMIQVPAEEVEKFEKMEVIPSDDVLKKLSGNLGIGYHQFRISAGYNMVGVYPEYYLSDGTPLDIDEILSKIYYKEPSVLPILYEIVEFYKKNHADD